MLADEARDVFGKRGDVARRSLVPGRRQKLCSEACLLWEGRGIVAPQVLPYCFALQRSAESLSNGVCAAGLHSRRLAGYDFLRSV